VFDLRPVLLVNGILVATLGLAMLVPALVDATTIYGTPDWDVFLGAAFATTLTGASLALSSRGLGGDVNRRQAFILTASTWLVLPAFGALPFAFSSLELSYTDSFFEAMSGLTTTGSTVIVGLDGATPGILLWRAILQWLGGIGIIVTAVAILPMLRIGGMQLFRMESSDRSEKILPRAAQISAVIAIIYVALSVLCAAAYWLAGMTVFEAMAHAMTTIATGGFSTSDLSIGYFDSALVDYIAVLFMLIGSLPFLLYFQLVRGRPLALWQDSQVRTFLAIIALAVAVMVAWRLATSEVGPAEALRYTTFNVVSIVTGTGYSTTDFGQWGGFAVTAFFFFMFVGGCAGSTSCSIKVFRYQVLAATARAQIAHLTRPHGVFVPHFNRRPIPDEVSQSVMSFFFLLFASFAVLAILLTTLGLDFTTAVSGAATAIANVGPGLGEVIGPGGTFASLPDAAKWVMSAGMLLGRLELFTVLVLFTPAFWRG
jgi:trk system potassium uptake protein TrkH